MSKTITITDAGCALLRSLLEIADADGPWDNPAVVTHGEKPFIELSELVGYNYATRFDVWRKTRRRSRAASPASWWYANPRGGRLYMIHVRDDGLFEVLDESRTPLIDVFPRQTLEQAERALWDQYVCDEYVKLYAK